MFLHSLRSYLRGFFIIILVCAFIKQGFSQDTEVKKIQQLLFSELAKAYSFENGSNKNIEVLLLPPSTIIQYGLDKKSKESFYIKANTKSLLIASVSVEGLQNGVYWYLNYLGFRYYFPNSLWYVVPKLTTPFKPVDKVVAPSFDHRRIWYAYGTGSKIADQDYQKWVAANLLGGEQVNAGHSYDGIVNRNKSAFQNHPEYFAQQVKKGQIPKIPKFEVSNESLVQLVIQDAFAQIEAIQKKTGKLPDMISMDPSDGGGFSTSPASLKIGKAGDQVFYVANRVAKAVKKTYPSVQIGLYAYYQHAAPPSFDLESNIVVLIATAMNQSALRTDELITAWKKKNIRIGIRDYYGVLAWDWDMPGKPAGSRISYIKQLHDYYEQGVRLFSAETNIGWISRGLGHYMAAQLLWDIDKDTEEIKKEFFKQMFGKASVVMEELFMAWQQYTPTIPLDGDLYDWYQLLEKSSVLEKNSRVQERIMQVKQYLHFVYLFKKWRGKSTDKDLVQLLNYAYRVQDAGIVASYPLFRRIADVTVAGKKNMRFNDPGAVWKQTNKPVTPDETNQNFYTVLNSLNRSEKMAIAVLPDQFKTGTKSRSVNVLKTQSKTSLPVRLRGAHKVVFHLTKENMASINLSAGLIKAREFKTLRLSIYPYNKELNTDGLSALLGEVIQPKQPMRAISLEALNPGTYIAVIDDARNGFTMSFSGAVSYAIVAGNQNQIWGFGRNNFVFTVGRVKEFKVKNDGVLTLISPAGRIIDLQKQKGIFTIKVQKGEEGIWKIERQSGIFHLQGILPFINTGTDFLLRSEE